MSYSLCAKVAVVSQNLARLAWDKTQGAKGVKKCAWGCMPIFDAGTDADADADDRMIEKIPS